VCVFWAACGVDWGVLVDDGAVLRGEGGGRGEFLFADVAVGSECGVGALGEFDFEAAYRVVGDGAECAARDALFADECFAVEVERDTVAL